MVQRAPAPLTAQTVRRNLCMTPSPALLAHEWAKHGTCAWPDPDAYYASAQRLYGAVRIPDMAALSRRGGLNAGDLRRALAARSPGLFAQAIRVEAIGQGGCRKCASAIRACCAPSAAAMPACPTALL
jgi:ribonuclease T2